MTPRRSPRKPQESPRKPRSAPRRSPRKCPIKSAREQIREHAYRTKTIRSLNCPLEPNEIQGLKEESVPLDEVESGMRRAKVTCAGVKGIRAQSCLNWKKESIPLYQLDLIGVNTRATFGVSSLKDRFKVEEAKAAVESGSKAVVLYASKMYLADSGYLKITRMGYLVFDTSGPEAGHQTEQEKTIRKNWSKNKRKL